MIDPRIESSYLRAMATNGLPIVVQRTVGMAPNATIVVAHVSAIVSGNADDSTATAKTGYSDRDPGSIGQVNRMVMVMVRDLIAEKFPLPIEKNDTLILDDGAGDRLNVESVDAHTRHRAGAIELRGAGVA